MTFDLEPYRELYPWRSHYLEVAPALRMHYLDEGQGAPVVMLHGNPTWSFYYRHLVRELSREHRCIVPDHIGCGLSDKPDDAAYSYVLERRIADVEALVDATLGDRPFSLIVHDWGGMIGLGYATRHPERVERLVVLNTAGFGLPPGRSLPWQIAVSKGLPISSVAVRGLNAFARGAARLCSVKPGRMTPLVRRAYLAPYDSWAHRIAVQRFVDDIPLDARHPSFAEVERVSRQLGVLADKPILVCWGRHDFVFDDAFLAEWRRRLPQAEVHVFEDAGHYVLEDAHEAIAPLVHRFLSESPPSRRASA